MEKILELESWLQKTDWIILKNLFKNFVPKNNFCVVGFQGKDYDISIIKPFFRQESAVGAAQTFAISKDADFRYYAVFDSNANFELIEETKYFKN